MSAAEVVKPVMAVNTQNETSCSSSISNTTNSALPRIKHQPTAANAPNNEKSENILGGARSKTLPKPPEEFYKDLQQFHERRGTPIAHTPKISGREVNLHLLYSEVTERGGFLKVNQRDEWDEVLPELGLRDKCVNATAALKMIYRRCLEKYERLNFFGEDPDKMEALEANDVIESGSRSRARYPSALAHHNTGGINTVAMSYNYRQHIVNMDRRRMYRLSTDLHKHSPYEKLMLSLISPLPNEQDFAINVCTIMANVNKHSSLKLGEYPKFLDVLLAHAGVFSDYTLRSLFQQVYTKIRQHSLYGFWRDLLYDKPQIMELYTTSEDQPPRDTAIVDEIDENLEFTTNTKPVDDDQMCFGMGIFNLGRSEGVQDWVGQRVQQILSILRNLSFVEDNLRAFAKNRTFLRFIVMSANIRWGNIPVQALDIAGNVAAEWELLDPTLDELSRSLMATLCDGVEGSDRAIIINCLEILYKLCQKDSNEEHIHKCLSLKFYQTICLFLSLNDVMLLIFTLEAIYALTSMGARSCHLFMQVRGIVDQLVSLITVEAQSYGPDGCILMRVVETVPGNMLPMVAQNIANLQNVAVIQKQQQQQQQHHILQHSTSLQTTLQSQPQLSVTGDPNVTITNDSSPSLPQLANPQQQNPQPTQTPQSFTHDDEQYALAWLGATFERTGSLESHVEQQELYRMYLSHCQKSGKHSVVNHIQFPRLVRLIFGSTVGPVVVRRRTDGTELPGQHYISIRLRAQPLPIQIKNVQQNTQLKFGDVKVTKHEPNSGRKIKKKLKPEQPQHTSDSDAPCGVPNKQDAVAGTSDSSTATLAPEHAYTYRASVASNDGARTEASNSVGTPLEEKVTMGMTTESKILSRMEESPKPVIMRPCVPSPTPTPPPIPSATTQQTASAFENPQITHINVQQHGHPQQHQQQPTSSLIKSLLANKVTQRQLKQKELTAATVVQTLTQSNVLATTSSMQHQPIKVASTAISALVNNQLMQNTPVKVGQTTIKPLNSQAAIDKKQLIESTPPPLAPLSGGNVSKDVCGRPVIINNQMLVEILDKKTVDPPIPATIIKRKIDDNAGNGVESAKRLALDVDMVLKEEMRATPSKNAANLYAEMAASILEDEDLDDMSAFPTQSTTMEQPQQSLIIPAKIQQGPLHNVQRQLVFQSNQPQLKLTQTSGPQIPTAMATIKTDQGLQTVPVILQQKTLDPTQPTQIIQQVIQQGAPQVPQQTQYVLATNPQGQTYLVAQQSQTPPPPPSSTQTVLVTQSPQQSAGTKTIIILQQQPGSTPNTSQIITTTTCGGAQKMIMTTPQGQQVLVTQRSQPTLSTQPQQQIFINPQTGTATHIHHIPAVGSSMVSQQSNLLQRQLIQSSSLVSQASQTQHQGPQSGQISPSLLSQLNHIPATIKLHQPQVSQAVTQHHHQGATITSRLGKSVSIMQQAPVLPPPPPPPPIQIPQLQQHQSIIQQHIVSGPSEKRQVLLGGRPVEIKETTVITQSQQMPQQSQLNSQTIITKQPQHPQSMPQQLPHSPIIQQQKIAVPMQQTHSQTIMMAAQKQQVQGKPLTHTQAVVQTVVPQVISSAQPTIMSAKKPVVTPLKTQLSNEPAQSPVLPQKTVINASGGVKPPPLTGTATVATITAQHKLQQNQQDAFAKGIIKTGEIRNQTSGQGAPSPSANTPAVTVGHQQQQQQQYQTPQQQQPQTPSQPQPQASPVDPNWLYVCDWRNCPRRKFKSLSDLQHHACSVHCPDHLDPAADIFCQWGLGPGLCDGIPRKRYSLMTHLIDRHITTENLRASLQRRIATGTANLQPTQPPVTIVRHNVDQGQRSNTASPAPSTSSTGSLSATGSSAIHAIKRNTADFVNAKELSDENEGPVSKSIRLTAALILRNLVTYTTTAKRNLRRYEPHLANIALSNVESSSAIAHILFEMNS